MAYALFSKRAFYSFFKFKFMKLYILEPINRPSPFIPDNSERNPWDPWYNKVFGFLIRANDEIEARRIAADNSKEEGEDAWLNSLHSKCEELSIDGDVNLIMRDFARA
jgi:hypothetical protein